MKIICFTCRKPVKVVKTKLKTVIVEMDEAQIHSCKSFSVRQNADGSFGHGSQLRKKAA